MIFQNNEDIYGLFFDNFLYSNNPIIVIKMGFSTQQSSLCDLMCPTDVTVNSQSVFFPLKMWLLLLTYL